MRNRRSGAPKRTQTGRDGRIGGPPATAVRRDCPDRTGHGSQDRKPAGVLAARGDIADPYLLGYNRPVIQIRRTDEYDSWFRKPRDRQAKARILIRIHRLSLGNPGDARPVGGGVSQLRIDHGPGWRVYFRFVDRTTVVLLTGGSKGTQRHDIERARDLARELAKGANG